MIVSPSSRGDHPLVATRAYRGGRLRRTMRTLVTAVCLFVLAWASPSRAQSTYGTLVGTVTDDTGAALPDVTVVVANVNTGVPRHEPAADAGVRRHPILRVQRHVHLDRRRQAASRPEPHLSDQRRADLDRRRAHVQERRRRAARRVRGSGDLLLRRRLRTVLLRRVV